MTKKKSLTRREMLIIEAMEHTELMYERGETISGEDANRMFDEDFKEWDEEWEK